MIKYILDLRPFEAFFRPKSLDWLSQNCAKLSERSKLYGLAVKATKSGVENWPRQRVFTGLHIPSTGGRFLNLQKWTGAFNFSSRFHRRVYNSSIRSFMVDWRVEAGLVNVGPALTLQNWSQHDANSIQSVRLRTDWKCNGPCHWKSWSRQTFDNCFFWSY